MCGINGILDVSSVATKVDIEAMNSKLLHRGPDNQGFLDLSTPNFSLFFGHTRLSIIDLNTSSNQPFSYENFTISFNGEIYNYEEIKSDLASLGHQFFTEGDTEVLIHAFAEWGFGFTERLNGMYSIAIYDSSKQKLYLIRDRAGVKPLYLYKTKTKLVFSSEIKAILSLPYVKKTLNKKGVFDFFNYGYILEPNSIFSNIEKIRAGFIYEIDCKELNITKTQYFNPIQHYAKEKVEQFCEKKLLETLKKAYKYRTISDVDLGIFLSAGYDSSSVLALLASKDFSAKTYTIGFTDKKFDESKIAAKIAELFNSQHSQIVCDETRLLEMVDKVSEVWDEPFADNSIIPTLLVSELASRDVKVVISADGGDELFGGYKKYDHVENIYRVAKFIPYRLNIAKILAGFFYKKNFKKLSFIKTKISFFLKIFGSKSIELALRNIQKIFSDEECEYILNSKAPEDDDNFDLDFSSIKDDRDKLLCMDYLTYQRDNILVKVDRATMACSIEGREPLLDFELFKTVTSLPSKLKYKKKPLRDIVHKFIDKRIMNKPKKGFSCPIESWLKYNLSSEFCILLNYSKQLSFVNTSFISTLYQRFLDGDTSCARQLWSFYIFLKWCKHWEIQDQIL